MVWEIGRGIRYTETNNTPHQISDEEKYLGWWVLHTLFPTKKGHCKELCQKHLTRKKGGIVFL